MSEPHDIFASDAVEIDLQVANKKALFQHLSTASARRTGLAAKTILASLNNREKIASTGFGAGTAIPHGKVEGLDRVFGYVVRLAAPIDFKSVDGLPVDLVVLLLSPPDAGADHLKALASVSRTLRDPQILAKMRGARSKDALFALIAGEEARNVA